MRKRDSSKVSVVVNHSEIHLKEDFNVITRNELFTFPNGDKYEGGYRINDHQPFLVRQGRGIYDTNDFNKYETTWEQDKIGSDLYVRYNNGIEYRGNVDKDGSVNGRGCYCFPDRSTIEAIFKENKPVLDIQYKEPLGYIWRGQLSENGDTVRFMTGNHFWADMSVSQSPKSKEQTVLEDNN